jgi:type IV secretion system protein VirD4
MTAPYQRRRDPQPIVQGWEVAFVAITAVLLTVAAAALTGLGLACAAAGRGWVWPHGTATAGRVLAGIFTGHPGRGLDPMQQAKAAPPAAVYTCVTVGELIAVALIIGVIVLVVRLRGPADPRRGIATRRETRHALGIGALHAARNVIRPDLYPHHNQPRRRS